ncbi:MAG: hypothetical protein EBY80_04575 [Actinobacteria bacterium]|nr:hypothetical protein [Actinomycetota bacterium]
MKPDLPLVEAPTRDSWRRWLYREHGRSSGVWVVTRKKSALGPNEEHVSAVDINEECLCFGWIDSRPARIDDSRSALLCTPRKAGSGWSKVNKGRLERLLELGLVMPAGIAAIERAKIDGSWNRLDGVDQLEVPEDLATEFDAWPMSRMNFDAFPPSTRRGILEWIHSAKTAATRSKRVAETARLAAENVRANQWPRPR